MCAKKFGQEVQNITKMYQNYTIVTINVEKEKKTKENKGITKKELLEKNVVGKP